MNYPASRGALPGSMPQEIAPYSQAMAPAGVYPAADAPPAIPYLEILANRKWTLVLFVLAGALLGTLAVWRQPYVYQARASLEVQGINENILNSRDVDPAMKTDNSSQSYINTEARLLQSGPLMDRVAAKLNTDGVAGPAAPFHPWTPPIRRAELTRGLKVRTHETDRILDVVMESPDPRRAAAIANAVASEFIQQDLESRWQSSKHTSEWLAHELDDFGNKLRNSEQELQRFTQGNNLVIDSEQGSVAEGRLRNVQTELARAQSERISKESVFESLKNDTPASRQNAIGDATLDQYQLQLTTLRKQLAELEATYAPDYYKIPPLKAQIAEMEKAYGQQRRAVLDKVENDYHTAQRREQLLQGQYAEQFKQTADQGAKMLRFEALRKEVETNRTIYSEMLQRVKGYSVASAMQASNVRVVDPAEVPLTPARPNKPLIAILGAMGGLMFGAFWLLARATKHRSIKEPGDVQQYLRSPELGVIPAASAERSVYARVRTSMRNGSAMPVVGGSKGDHSLLETVTWSSSPSLLAESFRSTSASLLLSKADHERPRVLLVTSVSPGEGKTTVTCNLAISLAGSAGRVLIIDGDRYRARLHKVFERSNDRGLSDLLQPSVPPAEQDPDDFIVDTAIPNLYLLPGGATCLSTPDLFYSTRMAALVARFRREYEVVLIDTPPMMHLPDARILGRLSDGVILVLRAGRVRGESAFAAEQRLREDGIPIIGTVLNDWDPKKNGYGVYPNDRRAYSYFAG